MKEVVNRPLRINLNEGVSDRQMLQKLFATKLRFKARYQFGPTRHDEQSGVDYVECTTLDGYGNTSKEARELAIAILVEADIAYDELNSASDSQT